MMRRQEVTVRLPMARIAPANKTFACSQTDLEKSGANSTINGINSAGNVGIGKTSFGEVVFLSLRSLPLLFQRPILDKVELSSSAIRLMSSSLPIENLHSLRYPTLIQWAELYSWVSRAAIDKGDKIAIESV